ncbi:MAG: glycosyltransferase family 4 protein [Candidatus Pacearchaeota archaeon]
MLGHYSLEEYSRGRILYKGLKKNNVDVQIFLPKGKFKYFKIAKRILKKNYDVIIATGVTTLFVVKVITKIFNIKKQIIFDAFISNYDTLVFDRKLVKKDSLKAKLLWLFDKYSCELADKAIVDTHEDREYFINEFSLKKEKFYVIPIGADDELFYPMEKNKREEDKEFNVTFVGNFIPLQGVEHIVKAAKFLENENIKFNLIGSGQTFNEMQKLSQKLGVRNIKFLGFKPIEKIPSFIANADICLGIFGITDKAKRVIPNKVYEAIAMKKPLITGNTPAIRRFFRDKENCILCEIGNPTAIANAILLLKNNPNLREKIAEEGYKLFKENFCNDVIGKKLKMYIQNIPQ